MTKKKNVQMVISPFIIQWKQTQISGYFDHITVIMISRYTHYFCWWRSLYMWSKYPDFCLSFHCLINDFTFDRLLVRYLTNIALVQNILQAFVPRENFDKLTSSSKRFTFPFTSHLIYKLNITTRLQTKYQIPKIVD